MYANNEIGTIQPIEELAKVAHAHGAFFHTDAVQAIGNVHIDVKAQGIDLLSMSAHKFYGPKGIGCLYIKSGVRPERLICGGEQERNQRAGTTNTPGVIGMGFAIEKAVNNMDENNAYIAALRDEFVKEVKERIPDIRYNGGEKRLAMKTVNGDIDDVRSDISRAKAFCSPLTLRAFARRAAARAVREASKRPKRCLQSAFPQKKRTAVSALRSAGKTRWTT